MRSLEPCQRKEKTPKCDCMPCQARRRYWGLNFSVQQQERLRAGETLELANHGPWNMQRSISVRNREGG
jgi:hypothetical protein